ncbi:unnamed protein product [Parnassius mnemosyne]|uniref:THAP-type domain-containing protein n=1 Tax=Parnassius mnemosyne TaxID=213953 RepID=A0AAV1LCJ9_9NEOP
MPSCVFKHCKSCSQKQRKEDGVSFHRLPTDLVLRDEWVTIIRQSRQDNNWMPSKFCVVCSLHFKEDDVYFTEKGRRLINKSAKPTKNLCALPPSPEKPSLDQVGPSNLLEASQLPEKSIKDNSVLPEFRDSDLDSIFDTRRKSRLRKDLRKHKLLRVATKHKLKTLQQKNRRLKKTNDSLKNILKDLKDKNFINCDTHSLLNVPVFNDMKKMIVGYIDGCVIRYVRKEIKCESCLTHLVSMEKQDFHKLIGLRDRGGLIFPSIDTYKVCTAVEIVIRKILKENVVIKTKNDYRHVTSRVLKSFIGNQTIFMNLENDHQCYGVDHKINLVKLLIEKYLMVRLHYIAKLETNARCLDAKRQYYKKLVQNKGC